MRRLFPLLGALTSALGLAACSAILGDFSPSSAVPGADAGTDGLEGSSSDATVLSRDADGTTLDATATDAARSDAPMPGDAGHLDAPADAPDGGASLLCPSPDETYCSSNCNGPYCPCVFEKSDPNNCGGCGLVCSAPLSACADGGCACPDAGTFCSVTGHPPVCTDVMTDPNNCGRCGYVCGADGTQNKNCVGGGCTSSPGH